MSVCLASRPPLPAPFLAVTAAGGLAAGGREGLAGPEDLPEPEGLAGPLATGRGWGNVLCFGWLLTALDA